MEKQLIEKNVITRLLLSLLKYRNTENLTYEEAMRMSAEELTKKVYNYSVDSIPDRQKILDIFNTEYTKEVIDSIVEKISNLKCKFEFVDNITFIDKEDRPSLVTKWDLSDLDRFVDPSLTFYLYEPVCYSTRDTDLGVIDLKNGEVKQLPDSLKIDQTFYLRGAYCA